MKLYVPPGTLVSAIGSMVQITFMCEQDADNFIDFLKWLNDPKNDGQELEVRQKSEARH